MWIGHLQSGQGLKPAVLATAWDPPAEGAKSECQSPVQFRPSPAGLLAGWGVLSPGLSVEGEADFF